MPEESAISLKNRVDPHVAKSHNRPVLKPRPPIQRNNCWTEKENTAFIDTAVRGWTCCPIYLIKRISDHDNEEEMMDDVFDGAHKIEAIINFIDNKYALCKLTEDTSPLKNYENQYFRDLPRDIRNRILDYKFMINYIDEETANDPDSLKILWERLNKGGKKLNAYELALPVISDLANKVLKPSLELFHDSDIFIKKESQRGQLEELLQIILATSEGSVTESYMKDFSSKKKLLKGWQDEKLGKTVKVIKENTEKNKEKWLQTLKKASSYMASLKECNCFTNDKGETILKSAHRGTELVFLLGRLVKHFDKPEDFRRICTPISNKIKENFFLKIERTEAGRNGDLQRRVLRDINTIVEEFSCKERRAFTEKEKKIKLKEQNNICSLCYEIIYTHQTFVGDHIIPWSKGGKTTLENCQVTHESCNLLKGDKQ